MNEILIIALLILLNGILAMGEIALISARKSHFTNELKNGSKSAKIVLKLIGEPDRFLSTIQIGITIIGILTGIYSGSVLADDLSLILQKWGFSVPAAHPVAQTVIVVVVTYFTLIFGELLPKRIGMSCAEKSARIIARPMYLLSIIAAPFVWLLAKSTSLMFNLLGIQDASGKVTEEEIKSMIQEGKEEGAVQEVEQDIMERVFLLGDLHISSLMTHRNDLVALDLSMDNDRIREIVGEHLYKVYPVIDRNFDNLKGVVTLKKLLFELNRPDFNLRQIIEAPNYFHENISVYKALEKMKEEHISHALIYDEFGTCQGIITLKDILEGLVGTIEEMHSEPRIVKRKEGEGWLIEGQCALHDFFSYFDKEYPFPSNPGFSTVGGLLLALLEHLPQSGESVCWHNFCFEIVDMDGARIDKILVKYKEPL